MELSYSTMRLLHDCPHNYLNKTAGIQQPESIHLTEGKEGHRIGQLHVSGVQINPYLPKGLHFAIVEKKDFDDDTRFEVKFGKYLIFGFTDGLDKLIVEKPTRLLEFKFSSSPWSLEKYKKDPQRKIYGWAIPSLKEAILVTGQRQPEKWQFDPPKTIKVPFTEQDYKDAEEYMRKSIEVLESGNFLTDLVDGKCTDPRCWYGEKCMFK